MSTIPWSVLLALLTLCISLALEWDDDDDDDDVIDNPQTTPTETISIPLKSDSLFTDNVSDTRLLGRGPRNETRCDRYLCNCNGDIAQCVGDNRRNRGYLPRLPPKIRHFRIMNCSYPNLTRQMTANLSNFQLQSINLTDNEISAISADAFVDFRELKLLDLTGNNIPVLEIQACLQGLSTRNLTTLSLGRMGIDSLPADLFRAFLGMTFKVVDLQANRLRVLHSAVFAPFQKLEKLDLNHNEISQVNLTAEANIEKIKMEFNAFTDFPNLCLRGSSETAGEWPAFRRLRSLLVSGNTFRHIQPSVLRGRCLPGLVRLDLSKTRQLTTLESNFMADLPRLSILTLGSLDELKRIGSKAFNSSSLKRLVLYRMKKLDRDLLPKRIEETFLYLTALEELYITDTIIDVNMHKLAIMLQPLRTLKKLVLQGSRTSLLLPGLLANLTALEHLEFTGNLLTEGNLRRMLEGVTSLKKLNVQANNINLVTESTLPLALRHNLTTLDLSINPYACDCQLVWFRRWLDEVHNSKKIKIVGWRLSYREQYNCAFPKSAKPRKLVDFNPTDIECAIYIVQAIAGCAVVVLLVSVSLVVYRYRWYIRFYIYRVRRRRLYKQIEGDDEASIPMFRYDAYLAHSPRDIDWIMSELLPLLEGEQGLTVFLEERDTVPGSMVVDNYTRFMDQSARIVLVISDSYNQDGWRLCEFEHILYATIEQQKDVIVVLLGDVEAGRMTCDMRRMLTRGTFLQWGDTPEARKTFKSGLKVALKTKSASPESIC